MVLAGALIGSSAYAARMSQTGGVSVPEVYSPNRLMLELWSTFKKNTLESTGRTIQKDNDGNSTAMGQATTMQRAVWMDDITTFDKSWQWTKDNLQTDDYHFANTFGELVNGNYGIKDAKTSAGADQQMAYGLIMASARWREGKYLWDSRPLMVALWRDHVRTINGKPVFVSVADGNTLNTADFAPQILRSFARVDPSHDWKAVLNNTYELLQGAQQAYPGELLATSYAVTPVGTTDVILTKTGANNGTVGDDSWQLAYALALDSKWNNDARALSLLASYQPLATAWHANHELVARYSTTGTAQSAADIPATYGMLMGYFLAFDQPAATDIYQQKLLTLYNPDTQSYRQVLGYRDDTWTWLGIALYNNNLPNIGGQYDQPR